MIEMKKGTKLTLLFIFTFMLSFLCVLNFNSDVGAKKNQDSIYVKADDDGYNHYFFNYNKKWGGEKQTNPSTTELVNLLTNDYSTTIKNITNNTSITKVNGYTSSNKLVDKKISTIKKVDNYNNGTYVDIGNSSVSYIEPIFALSNGTETLSKAPMHVFQLTLKVHRLYYDYIDNIDIDDINGKIDKEKGTYLIHDVVTYYFNFRVNPTAEGVLYQTRDGKSFFDALVHYEEIDGYKGYRINTYMLKYIPSQDNKSDTTITDTMKIRISTDGLKKKISESKIDICDGYVSCTSPFYYAIISARGRRLYSIDRGEYEFFSIGYNVVNKYKIAADNDPNYTNKQMLFINESYLENISFDEDTYDNVYDYIKTQPSGYTAPRAVIDISGSVYCGFVFTVYNLLKQPKEYYPVNVYDLYDGWTGDPISSKKLFYLDEADDLVTVFTNTSYLYIDNDIPIVSPSEKENILDKDGIKWNLFKAGVKFDIVDSSYNSTITTEIYKGKDNSWTLYNSIKLKNYVFKESGKYKIIAKDIFGKYTEYYFMIDNEKPFCGSIEFVDTSITSILEMPIDCDAYESKINIIITEEKLKSLYDGIKNFEGLEITNVFKITNDKNHSQPYDAMSGVKLTKFVVGSVSESKIVILYQVEDNAGNINEKELILSNSQQIEIVVKDTKNNEALSTSKTNEYNYQKTVYFEVSTTNNEVGIKNITVVLVDSDDSFIENILDYKTDKTKQFSLSYRTEVYRVKVTVEDNLGVEVSEYYNIKISEGENIISLLVENTYDKISFQAIVDTTKTNVSEIKFYYGYKNAVIGSATSSAHLLENDFDQYKLVKSSKTGYEQYDAVIVDFEAYWPSYIKNILKYYYDINALKNWPYIYAYVKTTGGFEYTQKAYLNFEDVRYTLDVGGVIYKQGETIALNSSEQLTNKITINHNISSLSDRLVYPLIYTSCYSSTKECGTEIKHIQMLGIDDKNKQITSMFNLLEFSDNSNANTIEIYQIEDFSSTKLTISDSYVTTTEGKKYYATKIATIVKSADSYTFDISVNRDSTGYWSNLNEGRGVFNIKITNTNSTSSIEPSGYNVTFYPINKTTGKVSTASIGGGSIQCSKDSDNSLDCTGYLPSNAETQINAKIEKGEPLYNDRLFVVVSATNQEGKEYRSTSQDILTSGVYETTVTEKIVYFDTVAPDIKYALSASNKKDEFVVQLLPFDDQDNLKSFSIYGGSVISSETLLLNRENIDGNTDIENGLVFTDEGTYTFVIEDNYGNVKTETITIERDIEGNLSSQEIVGSSNLIVTDDEDEDEANALEIIVAAVLILFFVGLAIGLVVLCIWLYFYLSKFIKVKKAADKAKKAEKMAKKAKARKEKLEQLKKKLLRKQEEEDETEVDEDEPEADEENDEDEE